MAQFDRVLQFLKSVAGRQTGDAGSDADLLRKYVEDKSEGAFAELVHRHGAMVYSIGRRILQNTEDANDVFQATFLALTRRAPSFQVRDTLGAWLHTVATNFALKLRAAQARRRTRENEAMLLRNPDKDSTRPAADADHQNAAVWHELSGVLDEELRRLPAKYRDPLVLCYLEGKSVDTASRELCRPRSSVGRWLMQGRELLRRRLEHRGISLGLGGLSAALPASAVAQPPAALVGSTIQLAGVWASGGTIAGQVSERVLALVQDMLRTQWAAKVRAAVAVVCLLVLATGSLAVWFRTDPAERPRRQGELPERPETVALCNPGPVYAAAFLLDGNKLLALCSSGELVLWSTKGEKLHSYVLERDTRDLSSALAVSANAKIAATLSKGRILLVNLDTGKVVAEFGHQVAGPPLMFSPVEDLLATGSADTQSVCLWNASTGDLLWKLPAPDTSASVIAFSHDGRLIAAGGRGKRIQLWSVPEGRAVQSIAESEVQALLFAPSDTRLAVLGSNGVRLWSATWSEQQSFAVEGVSATCIGFSRRGELLVSGLDADTKVDRIHVVNLSTGRFWRFPGLFPDVIPLQPIRFSSDAHWLATVDYDHVRLWDIRRMLGND